jgi:hypothetical protein
MDRGGTLLVISDQPEPFSAGFHAQQWASLLAPDTGYTKKVDFVIMMSATWRAMLSPLNPQPRDT